ncbi:MAG: alpha/beta family hydrolase [Gemmatimonadaceae bacterium]
MPTRWQVAVGADQTTALFEPPTAADRGAVFVCAHGAGGNMDDRGMAQLAGKPEQLRDKHLPLIDVPVLCFNGTRDALCRRDLMETALRGVKPRWDMHWLESADHGFHVLKSSGRTDADVLDEIGSATQRWVAGPQVAGPNSRHTLPLP